MSQVEQSFVNDVPIEEVKAELGQGWLAIEQMARFLYPSRWPAGGSDCQVPKLCRVRFAPSIITRSEVELFCMSMPRFAYRIYFEGKISFVNCRRLTSFTQQLGYARDANWGHRDHSLDPEEKHPLIDYEVPNPDPEELLPAGPVSFIADCLLEPPVRHERGKWHIITVDLHREYGEVQTPMSQDEVTKLRRATPFVKTVEFGGGLCAQACCFLATAIRHSDAKSVCGLGDITALASPSTQRELLVGGLDESEMVAYCQHEKIGLNAFPQFPDSVLLDIRAGDANADIKGTRDRKFSQCVHAYVASDMPVILLVDRNRLAGKKGVVSMSVYASNFYRPLKGSFAFLVAEFSGKFTTHGLLEALRADGIRVPDATSEIKSLNKLLSENRLNQIEARVSLPKEGVDLMHRVLSLNENERIKLNRLILEAAYPLECPKKKVEEEGGESRHAVLVVGTSREKAIPNAVFREFLLHDPSGLPFMHATVSQLAQVGLVSGPTDINLRHPLIIPVTPAAVKMPLLRTKEPTTERIGRGLMEDVCLYHFSPRIDPNQREFFLVPIGDAKVMLRMAIRIMRRGFEDLRERFYHEFCEELPRLANERLHWSTPHWVWLECGVGVVKIWDAEATISYADEKAPDPAQYLRAVIEVTGGDVSLKMESLLPNADTPVGPKPTDDPQRQVWSNPSSRAISASAISSFTVHGAEEAARIWTRAIPSLKHVDFYACMQKDLDVFFPRPQINLSKRNVVRDLADQLKDVGAPKRFADKLRSIFPEREIVAFTTFMPEILANHDKNWSNAQDALRFLIATARVLKSKDRPFTIEIVGGSRMRGVWRAKTCDGFRHYAVNYLPEPASISMLLQRLQPVAEFADNDKKDERVQLAIEVEPGPLFTVGDRDKLVTLCNQLNDHRSLSVKRVVGVNLDIPHWDFLSGVSISWLRQPENDSVRQRILHAHISDHDKGHFSDSFVAAFDLESGHSLTDFGAWTSFLKEVAGEQRPDDCPSFSGFVSCEMEACKDSSMLAASVKNLQQIA